MTTGPQTLPLECWMLSCWNRLHPQKKPSDGRPSKQAGEREERGGVYKFTLDWAG